MKRYDIHKLNQIPIDEVCSILNIDILEKKGINCFKGHDTKSPSLHFYLKTNTFYCFGCGIGSTNINLVMEYCEVQFTDACRILQNRFFGDLAYPLPMKIIQKKKKVSLFAPDNEVYQWILDNSELSSVGKEYLYSRGFNTTTLNNYKVFDIKEPYVFFSKLRGVWGDERLYRCGLLNEKDNRYIFAWWKHTIVFPYFDLNNQVTYLQGRYIDPCKDKDYCLRWVNLPNVSSSLFNMNILKGCANGSEVYICEGITDTLSLSQIGKKVVGVMGANNFKKEYVLLLKNYNIWVVPDNDNGGEFFFNDIQEKFSNYLSIKRLTFDKQYNDITDYIQGINNG